MKWFKQSPKNKSLARSKELETFNYPSLNLAFDLISEQFNIQRERLNALDTKANFSLGAATALVSTALVLQSLVVPSLSHDTSICTAYLPNFLTMLPLIVKRAIPLLPLLITYIITMLIGYRAYRTRMLIQFPKPDGLIYYLNEAEYFTKATLISTMVDVYEQNEKALFDKASLIDSSFLSLIAESICLIIFLLYHVIC